MRDSKRDVLLFCIAGAIPVAYFALLIAPYLGDGLAGMMNGFNKAMENPSKINLCEDSLKSVLLFLSAYALGIGIYFSTKRNYRRGEEHGSARWGNAFKLNKTYASKDRNQNKLMTQNVAIGLDGKVHRRNLNTLVCGGSGAGKTRFYCKPNLMQANTSFVVLDPKG